MDMQVVQDTFVAELDKFRRILWSRYHYDRCKLDREEYAAEGIALCWRSWAACWANGKDPREFAAAIAVFAARMVNGGRKLVGRRFTGDALARSPLGTDRPVVMALEPNGQLVSSDDMVREIADSRAANPAATAVANLGFAEWRGRLQPRPAAILAHLVAGEDTGTVAERFAMTRNTANWHRSKMGKSYRRYLRGE